MSTTVTIPPETEARVRELLEIVWIITAFTFIIYVSKILTRWRITRNLGIEDWIVSLSMLVSFALTITTTIGTSTGLGRHDYYLTKQELGQVLRLTFVAEMFAITGVVLPKFAVVIMLKKLMGPASHGVLLLNAAMVSMIVVSLIMIVLTSVQCMPLGGLWDPDIPTDCGLFDAFSGYGQFASAWSGVIDLVLALFPITIVWKLRIPVQRKIGICCVMGLGIFAAIAAAIKAAKVSSLTPFSDYSWAEVDLGIWICVETNLIIMCACFPSLLALYRYFTDKSYRQSVSPNSHKGTFQSMSSGGYNPTLNSPTTIGDEHGSAEDKYRENEIRRTVDIETQWNAV